MKNATYKKWKVYLFHFRAEEKVKDQLTHITTTKNPQVWSHVVTKRNAKGKSKYQDFFWKIIEYVINSKDERKNKSYLSYPNKKSKIKYAVACNWIQETL